LYEVGCWTPPLDLRPGIAQRHTEIESASVNAAISENAAFSAANAENEHKSDSSYILNPLAGPVATSKHVRIDSNPQVGGGDGDLSRESCMFFHEYFRNGKGLTLVPLFNYVDGCASSIREGHSRAIRNPSSGPSRGRENIGGVYQRAQVSNLNRGSLEVSDRKDPTIAGVMEQDKLMAYMRDMKAQLESETKTRDEQIKALQAKIEGERRSMHPRPPVTGEKLCYETRDVS
jgi:hypothetical protein